jgi:hypothetical protein
MPIPPRLVEVPTQEDIEKALGRLCTNALRTYWILEKGRKLMGLDCVREHLAAHPRDERGYALALRQYLEDPLERVESPQSRVILEIVLGLGDKRWKSRDWRREKAKARRKEAGRLFRGSDGEGKVGADTIRQHHEPKAVAALAELVWHDEIATRSRAEQQDDGTQIG